MNISIYVFGEFKNGYSQYPDDYTSSIFHQFYTHAQAATQIAIHRDGNLMYYGYIRKLSSSQYIGICIIINGAILSRFDTLFSIYEDTISQLVCQERLLRFNKEGSIESPIESLNTLQNEIGILKESLNTRLRQLNNITSPLPPVKYGTSKNSIRTFTILDNSEQILQSSYTEGYTYIYKSREYNSTQLKQYQKILQQLNKESKEVNKKYTALVKEHEKTLKQKKQFKIVCILSFIVAGIGILTILQTNNLNKTHRELSLAQDSIMQQNTTIELLNSEISKLEVRTNDLNNTIRNLQIQTEKWKTKISNEIPIIISKLEMGITDINRNIEIPHGDTIYSGQTMYLSPELHYIGIKQKQVTLYIKLFTSSGNLSQNKKSPAGYSYSETITISEGENSTRINGWGGKNKGHWVNGEYRIEIWYNDICLKAHTFKIYA